MYKKFWESLARHSNLVAYVILIVGLITIVGLRSSDQEKQHKDLCESILEDRLVLRDIVVSITQGRQTPEAEAFRQLVFTRLEIPPHICEGVNLDIKKFFEDNNVQIPGFTTTTTTPVANTVAPGSQASTPTVSRSPRTTTTTRPPSSTASTTTTSTPPTTQPPKPCTVSVTGTCVVQ